MPCAVSKAEQEYYERASNMRRFGVSELNHRITETVACELASILTSEQNQQLSLMALKWIAHHIIEDAKR